MSTFGLPAQYVAMDSADAPVPAHAVLQAVSEPYRYMTKANKLRALDAAVGAGLPLDLKGLSDTLSVNILVFLTCATPADGPTRLADRWPIKQGAPWLLLASDGSGLQWNAVASKPGLQFVQSFDTGRQLHDTAKVQACIDYTPGAIVAYQNQAWRILKTRRPSAAGPKSYLMESLKDSAVQVTVAAEALTASYAPPAETPAELENRAEALRRATLGLAPFVGATVKVDGLEALPQYVAQLAEA